MADGWTAMTHESHGFCFCGRVHCGNGRSCDSADQHPTQNGDPK